MGRITQAVMVQADIDVQRMGQADKVHLADEIFAQQPNLLASILVLPRMGVSMVELEVPLHILFVTFQAMKRSGHVWPIVSEDVQESCMQRLTARARFNEGLPADLVDQMVQQDLLCEGQRPPEPGAPGRATGRQVVVDALNQFEWRSCGHRHGCSLHFNQM